MNSLKITGPLVQHMARPWQSALHHSLGPSTCGWHAPCVPDGGVVPAGVVVSLLGTGCCHAWKGWCVTHHMSTSSFNTSQWRLCSLSIAAACQKSCHTSRLLPSRAKSWQMMCWYFTSSRAVWAQFECNMFQASIQELRTETCCLVLLFLATWPTSNPSSNRGRSWSTEP